MQRGATTVQGGDSAWQGAFPWVEWDGEDEKPGSNPGFFVSLIPMKDPEIVPPQIGLDPALAPEAFDSC